MLSSTTKFQGHVICFRPTLLWGVFKTKFRQDVTHDVTSSFAWYKTVNFWKFSLRNLYFNFNPHSFTSETIEKNISDIIFIHFFNNRGPWNDSTNCWLMPNMVSNFRFRFKVSEKGYFHSLLGAYVSPNLLQYL